MIDRKQTFNKRKSIFRSSTIITINENGVEKINLEDYQLEFKICKTNLANVYICTQKKTGKVFSMKIMKKADNLESRRVERLTSEFKILANVYHPFIIELKGVNNTNPVTLNFLFEFVPGGSLNSLLKSNKRLPMEHAKFYLASLITVIDYLHKRSIIYRDINPDNILINSNGFIKLADFSFAKKMESHDFTYSMCGSPEYYSPEMINKSGYNISTDFWELGILLYEMLVGCTPFMDPDPIKIYQKITKNKVIFPQTMNKSAKEIIKHFLVTDVNKRLGCTKKGVVEIIESPFFAGFDWRGLLYRAIEPPFIPVVNGPMDTSNYMKTEYQNTEENEDNIEVDKKKDPFYNW